MSANTPITGLPALADGDVNTALIVVVVDPSKPADLATLQGTVNQIQNLFLTTIRAGAVAPRNTLQGLSNAIDTITSTATSFYAGTAVAGAGTAYTASLSAFPGNPPDGQDLIFSPNITNTGATTLQINGATAWALRDATNNNLAAGDLQSGQFYHVRRSGSGYLVMGSWTRAGTAADVLTGTGVVKRMTAAAVQGARAVTLVTTSGGSTTDYTATCAALSGEPGDGQDFVFTPDVANTGAATLAINGGTARGLHSANGNNLQAGALVAGQLCRGRRVGSSYVLGIFNNLVAPGTGDFGGQVFARAVNAVELVNASAQSINHRATSTGNRLARLLFNAGDIDVYLGDGAAESRLAFKASQVFSDVRLPAYGSQTPVGTSVGTQISALKCPRAVEQTQITVYTGTDPTVLMAPDYLHGVRISGNIEADASHMPVTGMEIPIYVDGGCTFTINSGSGSQWRGFTAAQPMLTIAGPAYLRVSRSSQVDFWADVRVGSAVSSAVNPSARGESVASLGQSWAVRFANDAGAWGFQNQRDVGVLVPGTGLGLSRSVWAINAATGASALLKGDPTVITNYWWDYDNHLPGPDAVAAVAAIQAAISAGQPVPSCGLWDQWIGDASGMTSAKLTGQYFPALAELFAWLRAPAQLNLSTWPIICVTPGSVDTASETDGVYTAFREGYIGFCGSTDPHAYLGNDTYDLAPYRIEDNVHLDYNGQVIHGARLAVVQANVVHAQANYTGPVIASVTDNGDGTYAVVITPGSESVSRPTWPAGFALTTAGNAIDAAVTPITKYSWSGFTLTLTAQGAATGLTLRYPWGPMGADVRAGRTITSTISATGLRSYKP